MRFVIAQRRLNLPGGSETFVLTTAEHLALLGHEVVVWSMELGLTAQFGRQQGLEIVDRDDALPSDAEATIALDRSMAIELARRYPRAKRVYAMHNMDEVWLPPPEPGIVAATFAPNERLAKLAAGCAGAGNIIRIRQPIDLYRFRPRGCWARDKPARVLLLGNYREVAGLRVDRLRQAWSQLELEWCQVGYPDPTMTVAKEMCEADIIVGYGRTILEAMACGRPAYVHEHSGSDGWVTANSYVQLEADGFAGTVLRPTPTIDQSERIFTDMIQRSDSRPRFRTRSSRRAPGDRRVGCCGRTFGASVTTARSRRIASLRKLAESRILPISASMNAFRSQGPNKETACGTGACGHAQ